MISRAGMNTNFKSGHIKLYELPKDVRTKPLTMNDQLQTLSNTSSTLLSGGFESLGNKFIFEEGKHGACFHPTKQRTGLNVLQHNKTGDMVAYQEKDLETGKEASISLIQGDKQITVNNDEVGTRSFFDTAKAIITDKIKGR